MIEGTQYAAILLTIVACLPGAFVALLGIVVAVEYLIAGDLDDLNPRKVAARAGVILLVLFVVAWIAVGTAFWIDEIWSSMG